MQSPAENTVSTVNALNIVPRAVVLASHQIVDSVWRSQTINTLFCEFGSRRIDALTGRTAQPFEEKNSVCKMFLLAVVSRFWWRRGENRATFRHKHPPGPKRVSRPPTSSLRPFRLECAPRSNPTAPIFAG